MKESTIRLPGERTIEVAEAGDPTGRPVFVLHGTPGARGFYTPHVADAQKLGIRLISYSRPGCGGSTPCPGRRLVDAAADVKAIADDLGLDQFALWGHSGGAGPALACASALRPRLVAVASLAGMAPYPAEGIDYFAGMGEYNAEDLRLLFKDPGGWERKNREDAAVLSGGTQGEIDTMLGSLFSDVDKAVFNHLATPKERGAAFQELGEYIMGQFQESFRLGPEGMIEDSLALTRSWGFDLGSLSGPLQLWYGKADRAVPFSHGQWLVQHIPQAEAHLEKEEGHVTLLVRKIPEVHRWLLSKF